MTDNREAAFIEALAQNQHRIRKLCTLYTNNSEDRKDLEQEVILNIWKSFSTFRYESTLDTWIYRIILNVCIKHTYALNRKRRTIPIDQIERELSTEVQEEENYQELKSCIQALNFSDKTIIILFLDEVPYQSISDIVGITENHVAVKIKRIKSKLAKCLKKQSDG